jgi:hypothetical protein
MVKRAVSASRPAAELRIIPPLLQPPPQDLAMSNKLFRALALLALAIGSGCNGAGERAPSVNYQRQRAQQFDPYPENDIAPPIESRPREYTTPISEPERARWGKW